MEPATYRLRKNPYITKCLDASTGHIKKSDDDLLRTNKDDCPVSFYPYEYGYFIHVTGNLSEKVITEYGFSREFFDMMKRANKLGCKFLQLDADGIQYNDTPHFDW